MRIQIRIRGPRRSRGGCVVGRRLPRAREVVDGPPRNRRRRRARSPPRSQVVLRCCRSSRTPSRVASWWIARGPRAAAERGTRASRRRSSRRLDSRLGWGRSILAPLVVGTAARFHFDDLCGARARLGAADYVALLDRFDLIASTASARRWARGRRRRMRGDSAISSTCSTRDARCSSLRSPPRRSTCSAATTTRTANVRRCGKRRGGACARRARGEGTARRSPEKGAAAGDRRLSWGTWNGPPRVALGHRWRICRGSTSRSAASRRCVSRLVEMGSEGWERKWVSGAQ